MTEPAKATKGARPGPAKTKPFERYLIATKPGYLLPPPVEPPAERIVDRLNADHDVNVIRVIRPAERLGPPAPTVVVAEMPPDRAAQLASSPDLVVEQDQPLRYGMATIPAADPGLVPYDEAVEITVRVEDVDGEPVQNAEVRLIAATSSAPTVTDRGGKATLTVAAHEATTITGLLIQPRDGHWNAWRPWPYLSTVDTNRVVCAKIDAATAGSWPRRVMGFDRLPPTYRGHGVKIAIIDSGVAINHHNLPDRVTGGHDVVAHNDKTWRDDVIGFGTAVAGLLVATESGGHLPGLAPEVDLHVLKVFPGGRSSDLFEAIDMSITAQADVVVLDLGTAAPSWLIARKIEEAREYGVACIVAAGNNCGPVSFPASLPSVLSVAAIGKLGTFPPESYHITQFIGEPGPEGLFPARFSAYGPQIDVCAPGVGVVSTLPPNNFAALDGTAVAAGHVAALSALVLAHHPDFAGARDPGRMRVDRLFAVLRASCQPLPYSDRMKVGWGIPDAVTAVGLTKSAWAYAMPPPLMAQQLVMGG
jgi:subtilisin family serine protease